jgi:hypothetical protein
LTSHIDNSLVGQKRHRDDDADDQQGDLESPKKAKKQKKSIPVKSIEDYPQVFLPFYRLTFQLIILYLATSPVDSSTQITIQSFRNDMGSE